MADAPAGDIRSTILAELAAAPSEAVAEAAPVEVAEATEDAPTEEVEAAADEGSEDELEVEATDEVEASADDEDADLTSPDPETQKRLDAVRKAEKRMRDAAARRDAEFAQRQQEWQAKVDRVAEIDKLTARIKYDPAAVLRAFGVSADDFELIAQSIYAESPALANDPKQKAAAQARLKEREKEERQTAAEKKLAELEAKIEQAKKDAVVQAEVQQYVQQVNATAAKSYPLVAAMMKADPDETHDALVKVYNQLAPKLNRAPRPAEVVAAYDKAQRARLQKLGIDPATIAKTKPAAAKPAANTNKPAAAKPAPAATSTEAKKVPSRDEILAELAALPS